MVYSFNCTKCGKTLTQGTVLYEFLDNLYLAKMERGDQLNPSGGKSLSPFRRLRVRLLLSELRQILGAEHQKALAEPVVCRLSLQEMLRYIGNRHNLDIPGLEKLIIEDIEAYISGSGKLSAEKADLFTRIQNAQIEDAKSVDVSKRIADLKEEFRKFLELFTDGVCCFGLRLVQDPDNKEVITGFHLHDAMGEDLIRGSVRMCLNPRVCPDKTCSAPLFERAGAARQIKVGFIGQQGAGKTSAILAVADALLHSGANQNTQDFQDLARCMAMNHLHPVDLSNDEIVRNELYKYSQGQAPTKTAVKKRMRSDGQSAELSDAYSITLQLHKDLLLTLTDIPGEVFDPESGHIRANYLNFFESVLRVDAFVFCYDASRIAENIEMVQPPTNLYLLPDEIKQEVRAIVELLNSEAVKQKKNARDPHIVACTWLREIQENRAKMNHLEDQHVPVLILYMKDPSVEREKNIARAKEGRRNLNYDGIFRDERIILDTEELKQRYASFRELHQRNAADKYYYTELRCSPYGFVSANDSVRRGITEALNDASRVVETIRMRNDTIQNKIESLMAEVREKERAYTSLDTIFNEPSRWNSFFQTILQERQTAYGTAEAELQIRQREYNIQQTSLAELKVQKDQTAAQIAQAADAEDLANRLQGKVDEINARRKRNAEQQNQNEIERDRLCTEIAQLRKKCDDANVRYQSLLKSEDADTIHKWENYLQERQDQLLAAQRKLRDHEQMQQEQEQRMAAAEQEDNNLLQQYQRARSLADKHKNLNSKMGELDTKIGDTQKVLADAESRLNNARSTLSHSKKLMLEAQQYQMMPETSQEVVLLKRLREARDALRIAEENLRNAKAAEEQVTAFLSIATDRMEQVRQDYVTIMQESRRPEPKNVGLLGQWILHVSGAASMNLSDSEGQLLGEYFCRPPEFREKDMRKFLESRKDTLKTEDPQPRSLLGFTGVKQLINRFRGSIDYADFEEYKKIAAAHCHLFVNPTHQEMQMRDCLDPSRAAEILRNPD